MKRPGEAIAARRFVDRWIDAGPEARIVGAVAIEALQGDVGDTRTPDLAPMPRRRARVPASDHAPFLAIFDLGDQSPGPIS